MGHTPAAAEQKYHEIASLVDISDALHYLGRYFNDLDFTQFDLDAPFPDLGDFGRNGWESITETPQSTFMGTPTHIADTMQAWFEAGAADGFMISGAVLPDGLVDFIDHVLPILQQRGLFRTEYEADTLRGNLGLPKPANRYALSARQATAHSNVTVHR